MSSKIPNSNLWIQPNQIDHFSLSDFNPAYRESVEGGVDLDEIKDIDINVTLILRRAIDARASKPRNYNAYKNSQELLGLSYKELNSYVSNLDEQELEEVYGASPEDIQIVKHYLNLNNAIIKDINPERRTIEFTIGVEDFKNTFTNGDLIFDELTYINKNLDTSDSSLFAQGKLSESFSESLIGFEINDAVTSSKTANDVSTNPVTRTSFYPQEIGSAYNFPELNNSSGGEGVRIGLVGSGGNQSMQKMQESPVFQQYLRNQGIDPDTVPLFRSLKESEPDKGDPNEQTLDISVLTSIAPKAQIIASEDNDYKELIYNDELEIDIISSSVGKIVQSSNQSEAYEELFIDALLRGITLVIASGDQGTANMHKQGTLLMPMGVALPTYATGNAAALSIGGTSFSSELNQSPFEFNRDRLDELNRNIVVGGTSYDSLTGLIDQQSMWNDLSYQKFGGHTFVDNKFILENYLGSSGSWSMNDPVLIASYQRDNLSDKMDGFARKYPDISVLAGGNHKNGTSNAYTSVAWDEQSQSFIFDPVQGTSAGAPLTAGLLAVVAGDLKKQNPDAKIGFINPLLYEGYASDRKDKLFIDVPATSNNANVFKVVDEANWDGNFYTNIMVDGILTSFPLMGTLPGGGLDKSLSQTGTGFDDASGLGSLNGTELLDYLMEIHNSI